VAGKVSHFQAELGNDKKREVIYQNQKGDTDETITIILRY